MSEGTINTNIAEFLLKEDVSNKTIPSPGNASYGFDTEEQARFLREINSTLAVLTDTPALNPYYILERIKTRLKLTLGLTFDNGYFIGEFGSFEKHLVSNNQTLAHKHALSVIVVDNGWENKFPNGLTLRVQFLKAGTLYNVAAEVIATPHPVALPPISET
jgi:hypothetical protein